MDERVYLNKPVSVHLGIPTGTFYTFMWNLKKLSAEEQAKIFEEKSKCICVNWPGYNICAIIEREKLFCIIRLIFLCTSYKGM